MPLPSRRSAPSLVVPPAYNEKVWCCVRSHASTFANVPDFTSALFRRDGAPVDFAALASALVGETSGPSSYPEPRHLVGICPPDAVLDAVPAQPVLFPVPVGEAWKYAHTPTLVTDPPSPPAPFDRARSLPLGDGQKADSAWARERLEWESVYVLRQLLAEYDSRLEADCGGEGRILQHAKSDRQRLSPYRCQCRATCPACARAYSQSRGAEIVALLDALLQPGRLLPVVPTVKTWALVLSCDQRVSQYVDGLVQLDDRDALRRVMRHLTEDVHAAVRAVYGPGVACVVAWHWWHSSDPISGRTHLHAHVTVPNVSVSLSPDSGEWVPDLRPLRAQGVLSAEELDHLRAGFGACVASHRWARALGITADNWARNVHVRFTTQRDGQGYAHRARYDGRTSVTDLLDLIAPDVLRQAHSLHAGLIGEDDVQSAPVDVAELACNPDGVRWWVRSASVWQSVQTVRYTGWLVNAARKSLGLLREVSDSEPEWSSIGLYRVSDITETGVLVERWTSAGREYQSWHRDHVQLLPAPGAVTSWRWSDERRPLVNAGPPAAWLRRAGLGGVA